MSDEASRPAGVIMMTLAEIENLEAVMATPTAILREVVKKNQPDVRWIEQQFEITRYKGSKPFSREMQWRRLPTVLED